MAGEWHVQVCDVCRVLDGDTTLKYCFYCPTCDAWICESDADNWGRRARASAARLRERFAV